MTFEREPARLRTLKLRLPRELSAALEDAPADYPTPEELTELSGRLRAAESRRPRVQPRPPRGPIAAVALTFALGAAAGMLGSSGVFLALRATSEEPQRAASAAPSVRARPARAKPQAAASVAAPEPSTTRAPPRAAREATPSDEPPPPVPSSTSFGSHAELALLARAQGALAGAPAAALALADEHEEKFARGALVQEREVVAIDALLRLGRRTEAVGRALRFHQQFPGSVHGRRIDVLLGNSDHK